MNTNSYLRDAYDVKARELATDFFDVKNDGYEWGIRQCAARLRAEDLLRDIQSDAVMGSPTFIKIAAYFAPGGAGVGKMASSSTYRFPWKVYVTKLRPPPFDMTIVEIADADGRTVLPWGAFNHIETLAGRKRLAKMIVDGINKAKEITP